MKFFRKLVALLAVAAVLWTALSPISAAHLWAIIVPILLLAGLLAIVPAHPKHEDEAFPVLRFVPVFASRAPPSC